MPVLVSNQCSWPDRTPVRSPAFSNRETGDTSFSWCPASRWAVVRHIVCQTPLEGRPGPDRSAPCRLAFPRRCHRFRSHRPVRGQSWPARALYAAGLL